jgi:hypothetical protein
MQNRIEKLLALFELSRATAEVAEVNEVKQAALQRAFSYMTSVQPTPLTSGAVEIMAKRELVVRCPWLLETLPVGFAEEDVQMSIEHNQRCLEALKSEAEEAERSAEAERLLGEELAAQSAKENLKDLELEALITAELAAQQALFPACSERPSSSSRRTVAGSPAAAARRLRKASGPVCFRMDVDEIEPETKPRESSLARGYDSLGAQVFSMDNEPAPRRSAMEMDLGTAPALPVRSSKARSAAEMDLGLPAVPAWSPKARSSSLGALRVSKQGLANGSSAGGFALKRDKRMSRTGDSLAWSMSKPVAGTPLNLARMSGSAGRRHRSVGGVF